MMRQTICRAVPATKTEMTVPMPIGPIQDPANQQNYTDDDGLHQTDGMIWESLAQGDCQRIARAAALPGRHIKILPEAHHEQPDITRIMLRQRLRLTGMGRKYEIQST